MKTTFRSLTEEGLRLVLERKQRRDLVVLDPFLSIGSSALRLWPPWIAESRPSSGLISKRSMCESPRPPSTTPPRRCSALGPSDFAPAGRYVAVQRQ